MGRTYTKIPVDTFETLQLNAGIVVDSFAPATGTLGNILGATTGGLNITHTHTFSDMGEDIDNCPKNTMELKQIDSTESKIAGTFVSMSANVAKKLMIAETDANDTTHIVPKSSLVAADFGDIWWVGDYGTAGSIAIHLMNALSNAGFALQSTDKGKGQFAFEFLAHYSIATQDVVPFEVFVATGD